MRLLLKSMFGSIDEKGNLLSRQVNDDDLEYLAEVIDWTEIEGVRFDAKMKDGELEIIMEGDKLSSDVTVNYTTKINVVKQIVHKSPEAKLTSSILNKFIRKTMKMLNGEPCNRGKKTPPNIILIKDIDVIE